MTDLSLQNNAMVASQSSQYISIVPENGEQFNPQQKIIYNIEPEIGYIKNDSYIVFDVLNNSADKGRYTFQKNLGAHAIIDRVDIYSKETGILLESNTNYGEWCNVLHQYLYDDNSNLQNSQGVGKPVQSWEHRVLPDANGASTASRSLASSIDIENNQLSPVNLDTDGGNGDTTGKAGGSPAYATRRFCIPLKVGLFGAYEGNVEKAIPVLNFGGLRIEITLASAKKALQPLCLTDIKLTNNNEANKKRHTDWLVGAINVVDGTDQRGNSTLELKISSGSTAAGFSASHLQDLGICFGNKMKWVGTNTADAALTYTGTVSKMEGATAQDVIIDGNTKSVYQTMKITLDNISPAAGANGVKPGLLTRVLDDCNYKVMNTEFRLKQIVAPPQVADATMKGINYEFLGYEVFMNNIPTGSMRHQIPINSVASKAVATFTILHDSSNGEGETYSSADVFNGILPDVANLNEVVYWINNKMYPLRAYNPQHKGDKCLALNELVKAFRACGLQPANLGNMDFGNGENYTNTPMICRELAKSGFVFDLRNAEPELRLSFSATRANILRANTFVFSKKIIQTTATGLQVIH